MREQLTVSVVEKYKQLCKSGSHPVCLFPTCKQCQDHNSNMLSALGTKLETFACVDEIDETSSTRKWNKKATDALSKANKDCNMTAGLEAKLESLLLVQDLCLGGILTQKMGLLMVPLVLSLLALHTV